MIGLLGKKAREGLELSIQSTGTYKLETPASCPSCLHVLTWGSVTADFADVLVLDSLDYSYRGKSDVVRGYLISYSSIDNRSAAVDSLLLLPHDYTPLRSLPIQPRVGSRF